MGQTILIVHSHAAMRHMLRVLLGFLPCIEAVSEACDSASVLARVAALRPDTVVIGLDGALGLDMVRQLRAAGFGGRITALTTNGTPALGCEAWGAGADVVVDMADVTDGWLSTLHRSVCSECAGADGRPDEAVAAH